MVDKKISNTEFLLNRRYPVNKKEIPWLTALRKNLSLFLNLTLSFFFDLRTLYNAQSFTALKLSESEENF